MAGSDKNKQCAKLIAVNTISSDPTNVWDNCAVRVFNYIKSYLTQASTDVHKTKY